MTFSFLSLLLEGGKATKEFHTTKVSKDDFFSVVKKLAEILEKPEEEILKNVVGSSRMFIKGDRKESGDIDIVVPHEEFKHWFDRISEVVSEEVDNNHGTKIASFAFPVKDKKVQVDLIDSLHPEYSKFIYYSSEGENSKYKGVVRNLLLMAVARHIKEDGKDFKLKDGDGNTIAKAARSLKLDTGLERLFKVAKEREDGQGRVKAMSKVSPEELKQEVKKLGKSDLTFSEDADAITDPDHIASFLFGDGVTADDIMTAEQVMKQIKTHFSGDDYQNIIDDAKETMRADNAAIPSELR